MEATFGPNEKLEDISPNGIKSTNAESRFRNGYFGIVQQTSSNPHYPR